MLLTRQRRWLRAEALALSTFLLVSAGHALDRSPIFSGLHHTTYRGDDGASANVDALAQTTDGYLWLGTGGGLYRFDGVRFDRIGAELLRSPSIHSLAATPSGGLWTGYERPIEVISLLEDGAVRNLRVDAPSSTNSHRIVVGPHGAFWAATPDFILRFDGSRIPALDGLQGAATVLRAAPA
jgi:ligand-binding sensor domain-containing protein